MSEKKSEPADTEQRYQKILDNSRGRGEVEDLRQEDLEMRDFPRIKAEATRLTVKMEVQVTTHNISMAGVTFFSDYTFILGQVVNITIADVFSVRGEVVECEMEEADPNFLESHYRVHCKFQDPEEGKQMVVMVKEHEELMSLEE